MAKRYYELSDLEAHEELKVIEVEVDKVVAGLYGIVDEVLEVVRKAMGILS